MNINVISNRVFRSFLRNGGIYLGVLIFYILVMSVFIFTFTSKADSLKDMILGGRNVSGLLGALSIGATWIWAPALFVSSENAYSLGMAGFFWFFVPNILTLLMFIPFAKRLNQELGDNFTLPSWMGERHQSERVKRLYNLQMSVVSILSTGVQIIAGAGILAELTGLPYHWLTVVIGLVALAYSQWSGIKASIMSDAFNMVVMLVVSIGVVWGLGETLGWQTIGNGFGGITGLNGSILDRDVFLTFGLSSTIGLLSGTFGDQNFWQLAGSIKSGRIGKAFGLGALFFAIVPLMLGLVGFMAAGVGFEPNVVGRVNLEFIQAYLPSWVVTPFLFMIVGGLMSTVDSNASSIAGLASDVIPNYTVGKSRWAMGVLVIGAIAVANSGVTVPQLFLIYGTIRATTMLPTVMTFMLDGVREKGVFYGIIGSMITGVPTFIYGSINGDWRFKVAGSLLALLVSGSVVLINGKTREV